MNVGPVVQHLWLCANGLWSALLPACIASIRSERNKLSGVNIPSQWNYCFLAEEQLCERFSAGINKLPDESIQSRLNSSVCAHDLIKWSIQWRLDLQIYLGRRVICSARHAKCIGVRLVTVAACVCAPPHRATEGQTSKNWPQSSPGTSAGCWKMRPKRSTRQCLPMTWGRAHSTCCR